MAKKKVKQVDVSQFRGLVVQRALVYYSCLPLSWKASVDFEDFVQMGFEILVMRMQQHDPARGGLSTIAYQMIESAYKGFLEKISYKKRAAEVVSLDAEDSEGNPLYPYAGKTSPMSMMQTSEAAISVRRLHNSASYKLLQFLDDNFFRQDHVRVTVPKMSNAKFVAVKQEFQALAKKHGVTCEVYRAAIAQHHERMHTLEQLYR